MEQLLPHIKYLRRISISNSTISNIGELLKFQTYYVSLDNITFENDEYDENISKGLQLEIIPGEFYIKNTSFNGETLKDFWRLAFFFITDCHITNFYAFTHLPSLYQLELKNVTFGSTKQYESPTESINRFTSFTPNRRQKRLLLQLENCHFADMEFFQPFATTIWSLSIISSEIGNMAAVRSFKKMNDFHIDADCIVLPNNNSNFNQIESKPKKVTCYYKSKKEICDLRSLAAIANYFNVLSLKNCETRSILGLDLFTNITTLMFENCQIQLENFLSVANHIECVDFKDSTLHDPENWTSFKNVDTVKVSSWNDVNGLKGLVSLLPLKHQLKRLRFSEEIEDAEALSCISKFSKLEVLAINLESINAIRAALSLASLKKLDVNFYLEEDDEYKLDVSQLINIEHLEINGANPMILTGFEHLKNLSSLELNDTFLDVNNLPAMPQLKRLALDNSDYEVNGLSQFMNLEQLKISSAKSIKLKKLHKLKILDLSNNIYVDAFDCFNDVSNIEKLSLSAMYREDSKDVIDIYQLKKLKKLKWLSFLETELSSLDGIEHLESLEYLDLYNTSLTDVTRLNELKKLKEVNLAINQHQSRFEILAQLSNPEIALFIGLPSTHFRVWKDINLWED